MSRNVVNHVTNFIHLNIFRTRKITWKSRCFYKRINTSAVPIRCHETGKSGSKINVIFIDKAKKRFPKEVDVGTSVLHAAQKNDIPIEGACDSSLACCTCHVYIQEKFLDLLPEAVKGEEDMLDMAPFLKANSRLGCQVILTPEMEGMEIALPPATRNFYIDGKVPDPH